MLKRLPIQVRTTTMNENKMEYRSLTIVRNRFNMQQQSYGTVSQKNSEITSRSLEWGIVNVTLLFVSKMNDSTQSTYIRWYNIGPTLLTHVGPTLEYYVGPR